MDYYYSYLIVEGAVNATFIQSATRIKDLLVSLKEGDIFNIKGLGRYRVIRVNTGTQFDDEDYDSDNNTYNEIGFVCEYVSEYWTPEITERVNDVLRQHQAEIEYKNKLYDVLQKDYLQAWGYPPYD